MPLVIEERDNLSCPLIRCDHCAEEINPASDGNYQWRMSANGQCCPSSPVFFTHKRCCWAFEHTRREGGVLWGAMELSLLPILLERTSHLIAPMRSDRRDHGEFLMAICPGCGAEVTIAGRTFCRPSCKARHEWLSRRREPGLFTGMTLESHARLGLRKGRSGAG